MSSILDALNKLEQEQAQVELEEEIERDIDPRQAARELVDGLPSPARGMRLTPAALLLGGAILMVLMVGVSIGVTMIILGGSQPAPEPGAQDRVAADVAVAAPAVEKAPVPAPDPERESAAAVVAPAAEAPPIEPEPGPAPVEQTPRGIQEVPPVSARQAAAAAPRPEPERMIQPSPAPVEPVAIEPVKAPERAPAVEPVLEEPEPEPAVEPRPFATARREPVARPKPEPAVEDIRQLPPLSRSVEQRYGADPVLINMISPASASRPYAYAIINRIKVTVGDYIGSSRLKLVEVENHGIAVEAAGERYYVAF